MMSMPMAMHLLSADELIDRLRCNYAAVEIRGNKTF